MRRLITAAFALSLLASPVALAADNNYSHGDNYRHEDNNRDNNQNNDRYRHANNNHRWHRGDRIGRSWFLYVPVDWRAHHFRNPASGYHWIYADGLYLLVDRNGVVIEVEAG
jgi:Ni/Co efflux regulator RcnB